MVALCFEGRRSGKRYEVPALYHHGAGGSLDVLTSVRRVWWRNIESGAPVTVLRHGKLLPGRVEVVRTAASADAGAAAEEIRRALASRDILRRALMPLPAEETALLKVWAG